MIHRVYYVLGRVVSGNTVGGKREESGRKAGGKREKILSGYKGKDLMTKKT